MSEAFDLAARSQARCGSTVPEFRRFADGLVSKQAAVLDRLEIAALNEIGS